jgi:hypothetical protein
VLPKEADAGLFSPDILEVGAIVSSGGRKSVLAAETTYGSSGMYEGLTFCEANKLSARSEAPAPNARI